MNNYYQSELKKAFYSKKFLLSTILTFICLCIGGIEYLSGYIDSSSIGSFYLFIDSHSSGFYSILIFLSPVICSIPFSLSYLDENESNISDEIDLKKYIKAKTLANMFSGGMTLSLGIVIYYLFLFAIKGIIPSDITYYDLNQSLGSFIINSQYIYILVEIILTFIFGVTFSNLTFCMSFILKDKYLSIFSSIFFYMISVVVLSNFSDYLNSQIIYSFSMHIGIGILPRLIYAFILNIISIIILNLSFKLKDVTINSILSFKIISYVFMVLCIYFKIDEFLTVSNNEGTIYEFLIYLFNNLYTISYFIVFCFMAFALNLLKKNEFKNSLLCDLKNILIVICKFMAIFLALSLLIATFKMDLSLEWSEFNKSSEEFVSIYKTYTPLFVLFISVIHISLYLFSIAFICITLSKISKNTILGLITTFGLIILNISTSIGRIPALTTFSLSRNAMSTFSLNSQSGYLYFVPSLIYWICLIIVICNIYNDYCDVKLNIKLKNKKSITS